MIIRSQNDFKPRAHSYRCSPVVPTPLFQFTLIDSQLMIAREVDGEMFIDPDIGAIVIIVQLNGRVYLHSMSV